LQYEKHNFYWHFVLSKWGYISKEFGENRAKWRPWPVNTEYDTDQ
jgi:hypothetical protein